MPVSARLQHVRRVCECTHIYGLHTHIFHVTTFFFMQLFRCVCSVHSVCLLSSFQCLVCFVSPSTACAHTAWHECLPIHMHPLAEHTLPPLSLFHPSLTFPVLFSPIFLSPLTSSVERQCVSGQALHVPIFNSRPWLRNDTLRL